MSNNQFKTCQLDSGGLIGDRWPDGGIGIQLSLWAGLAGCQGYARSGDRELVVRPFTFSACERLAIGCSSVAILQIRFIVSKLFNKMAPEVRSSWKQWDNDRAFCCKIANGDFLIVQT